MIPFAENPRRCKLIWGDSGCLGTTGRGGLEGVTKGHKETFSIVRVHVGSAAVLVSRMNIYVKA